MIVIDTGDKPRPLGARHSVIEQEVRTTLARPVEVRHHVAERNIPLLHLVGDELGGTVKGARKTLATLFAHFNADGIAVARATGIGVEACFREWDVLHRHGLVHRVMPVVTEGAVEESSAVLHSPCVRVLRVVDGDETRFHGVAAHQAQAVVGRQHHGSDHIDFTVQLAS